ncbi:MAG: T9SS type A sorting domain-containing protein [Candidatus Latescibacteria bacterium]|nr:T9SS type A sorting domain-containing protein [Candidatus Latescibacterota bacterium]
MYSKLHITLGFIVLFLVSAMNLHALNYHALVVGLAYPAGLGYMTTRVCYYDANGFYNTLIDSLGWDSGNITLMLDYDGANIVDNGNKDDILDALAAMPKGEDDINVFFFSGHGLGCPPYIVPADHSGSSYYETLTASEIYGALSNSGTFSQFVCFFNSCYSGCLIDPFETLRTTYDDDYSMIMTASDDHILDYPYSEEVFICVWPYFLFKSMSLNDNNADQSSNVYGGISGNKDHLISVREVFSFAGKCTYDHTNGGGFEGPLQEPKMVYEGDLNLHTVSNLHTDDTYTRYISIEDALVTLSSGDSLFVGNNDTISDDIEIPSTPSNIVMSIVPPIYACMIDDDDRTISIANGKKIEVAGRLHIQNNTHGDVIFSKVSDGTYWSGIDIKSGGVLDADGAMTIQYANSGIDIENSNGLSNGLNIITIRECNQCGIFVNNCSPTIRYIICDNVSNSTYQNGGITISGSSANPAIHYIDVLSSYYGIYVATSSTNAVLDYCDIQNTNTSHSIQVNSNCCLSLCGGAFNGNNNIVRKNEAGIKAINNPSTGSIYAEYNWWGVNPPTTALFTFPGNVDYTNYLTSAASAGAGKAVALYAERDLVKQGEEFEFYGDYESALTCYYTAFAIENDLLQKKYLITSILRVIDKYGKNYSNLQQLIDEELATAEGWYKASLDFIQTDILFRENKYEEAVEEFVLKSAKYDNTSMETEMLARAAEIAGSYLNDKNTAQQYASLAADNNPGFAGLRLAYDAAGTSYDLSQYTDKFWGIEENFDVQDDPDENSEETADNSVGIYPNPANPSTTITYSISDPSHVRIAIYNMAGQKITTLINSNNTAGTHSVVFDGSNYASGIYFYRFETPQFSTNGKFLLMK